MDQQHFLELTKKWHGSLRNYLIGFFFSLILTLASFWLVIEHSFEKQHLILVLAGLALIQAIFQLIFFLHVGKEEKPKWELLVCLFMIMVLFIIVLGSLWIMQDLDTRVMIDMSKVPSHIGSILIR